MKSTLKHYLTSQIEGNAKHINSILNLYLHVAAIIKENAIYMKSMLKDLFTYSFHNQMKCINDEILHTCCCHSHKNAQNKWHSCYQVAVV